MTDNTEVALGGGRLTPGVVRVGDTVRRPRSARSAFVARLLWHLADAGFDGSPAYLGQDEAGRDVLSYLPGEVPPRWRRFRDDQVVPAAALLRRFHDTARDLAAEYGSDVICHRDPGPNNVVFQADVPTALIDFDLAEPGDGLADVAYMAWAWCISSRPDREPVSEQARQVRLLADAYGLESADRGRLPAAIRDRLGWNVSFWRRVLRTGEPPGVPPSHAHDVIAWTRRETAFVVANHGVFAAALAG